MKNILVVIFILSLSLLTAAIFQAVQASSLINASTTDSFNNNLNTVGIGGEYPGGAYDTTQDLETIIGRIIRFALSLLGMIFIILMFLTGNDWMQAAGNEEKVRLAKSRIQSLLIGLVVVLISFALSYGFSGLLAKLVR